MQWQGKRFESLYVDQDLSVDKSKAMMWNKADYLDINPQLTNRGMIYESCWSLYLLEKTSWKKI